MNFNAKEEVQRIIDFIRNYYQKNNLKGIVIGISGGKDSAVVAGLFTLALGKENVIGLTLPCHSNDKDKSDAKIVADHFGFKLYNIDLTKIFDIFKDSFDDFDYNDSEIVNSDINLKPRLRMSALYYVSAMLSSKFKKGYLVAGCGNKSEKFIGYTTKWGDNASDIEVIGDFTVHEVIKIGEEIGVPKEILYKTPNDGLSNKSDEEKLGFTYDDIEKVMNGEEIDENVKRKILRQHDNNLHKTFIPGYRRWI